MDLFPQLGVNRALPAPLSDQLTERIRSAVLAGWIAPGEALPPTRRLAVAIGVSRSVVVAAYERLTGEGYLESRQGAGTRVTPELPLWRTNDPARAHCGAAADERAAAETELPVGSARTIDLRPGRPHAATVPPRSWTRALSAAAKHPWLPDASDSSGEVSLRKALADHARRARGIDCAADDVVVTTGTSEALLLLALALCEVHGRPPRIAVEDPGYREGIRVFERVGAEIVPLAVGVNGATGAGLRMLSAQGALDAVLLTPSHQFPLGGRISAAERLAILAWARETGAVVIEDDYDSEFRHAGALLPAMGSLDRGVATITTLNKVLSPSIRCGAIVLGNGDSAERRNGNENGHQGVLTPDLDPDPAVPAVPAVPRASTELHTHLRAALHAVRADLGPAHPLVMQLALAEFLESGGFRREIARTRREYRHRREQLLEQLAEAGIPVQGADGGLHVVIPVGDHDATAAVAELERRGVLVDCVQHYRSGLLDDSASAPPDALIVGYGAEPAMRLRAGIAEILAVLGAPAGEAAQPASTQKASPAAAAQA
ncbi:GntR family transcriptional regulator/MocR family aminotransferase [Leucobacter luti]|uniref:GntR family transcriptional regulator/MocR family aminotransferase n=1 Tax=Leucobacter luti TaxID=340320 RepID=A0A4R6S8B3_9MICO|nr:PLP-dependent aminotransferase family protein [Leucobacter luti]TDP95634.1 GntR family transcriptional regulator/MocR family aminotransferase [Leucobacter luti]